MDEQEARNELDMLRGNLNRMFLTDDVRELLVMYEFAKKRLERICEYRRLVLTSQTKYNT